MEMSKYFECPGELLDRLSADHRLSAAAFRVLLAIMERTQKFGDPVPMSIASLVNGTGLERSTVIRARQHLVALGYLLPGEKGAHGLSSFVVAMGEAAGER